MVPTTFFGRSNRSPILLSATMNTVRRAAAYFDYWDNVPDYYSVNAGGWHIISLNSLHQFIAVDPTSPQYQWLEQDLAANRQTCTIVYYHHPVLNIGPEGRQLQLSRYLVSTGTNMESK